MPLLKARRPDQATVAGHVPGPGIEVAGLSKRYGARTAVDNVSFGVRPGSVTGFLAMLEFVGLTAAEAGRRAGMRKNT